MSFKLSEEYKHEYLQYTMDGEGDMYVEAFYYNTLALNPNCLEDIWCVDFYIKDELSFLFFVLNIEPKFFIL